MAAQLESWLEIDLRERFAGKILPVDADIADRWGQLAGEMKQQGTAMPVLDAILAATALHHDLTIVSRNVGDFRNAQVRVINPWEAR